MMTYSIDRGLLGLVLALVLLGSGIAKAGSQKIEVEALFTDAAVLRIDGQRKMMKVGQTFGGVTLVSAYSQTVTLEVDGKQQVLGLSRRIGSVYEEPIERVVTIHRNTNLQYQTTATINGRNVPVLVDTGANIVAISADQAPSLGILEFYNGTPGRVETAGGVMEAWSIILEYIDVGGIRINKVEAMVIDGDFPGMVLLGMTYLRHVEMNEKNGVLSLTKMP